MELISPIVWDQHNPLYSGMPIATDNQRPSMTPLFSFLYTFLFTYLFVLVKQR